MMYNYAKILHIAANFCSLKFLRSCMVLSLVTKIVIGLQFTKIMKIWKFAAIYSISLQFILVGQVLNMDDICNDIYWRNETKWSW